MLVAVHRVQMETEIMLLELLVELEQSILEETGETVEPMLVLVMLVITLAAVAAALGLITGVAAYTQLQTEEEVEMAYYKALDLGRAEMQQRGMVDQGQAASDMEEFRAMEQDGRLADMMRRAGIPEGAA